MSKLNIIYASTTGNTEQMATYIEEGAKEKGVEVEMITVDVATEDSLNADFIALGSSAAGAEEILPEMVDFLEEHKEKLSGKKVGLFGSYDWGGGEFMETWKQELEQEDIQVVGDGLIVNLAPDDDEKISDCKNYGIQIVE